MVAIFSGSCNVHMITYLSIINLHMLTPPPPSEKIHIVFKIIISFIPVIHSKRISS